MWVESSISFLNITEIGIQGGHKPGKLKEFEELPKSQGKLLNIFYFCGKTLKTQGKYKIWHILVNENVFQRTFLPHVSQGKV